MATWASAVFAVMLLPAALKYLGSAVGQSPLLAYYQDCGFHFGSPLPRLAEAHRGFEGNNPEDIGELALSVDLDWIASAILCQFNDERSDLI